MIEQLKTTASKGTNGVANGESVKTRRKRHCSDVGQAWIADIDTTLAFPDAPTLV